MSSRAMHTRSSLAIALSLTLWISPAIAQQLPEAVARLSKEPITVSGSGSARGGKSFDIPNGQAALIETDELLCFLELQDAGPKRKAYTFRTFHKASGYEITGEGEVLERHYRISEPGQKRTRIVDKGSVVFVDAGFLKIRWSFGRWLYYDPTLASVSAGSKAEYEAKLEPHRPKP